MKIVRSKEWWMRKAAAEGTSEVGVGALYHGTIIHTMAAYDTLVGGGTRARRRYLAKVRTHLRGTLSSSERPKQ